MSCVLLVACPGCLLCGYPKLRYLFIRVQSETRKSFRRFVAAIYIKASLDRGWALVQTPKIKIMSDHGVLVVKARVLDLSLDNATFAAYLLAVGVGSSSWNVLSRFLCLCVNLCGCR